MNKYKKNIIRWFLISTLLVCFTSVSSADPSELAIVIDGSALNSSEIEIKKALIHTALHYQWEIIQHERKLMLWDYKGIALKMDISDSVVNVYKEEGVEINSKWLPRIKKLILRRLEYFAEVRKAESLIE